VMNVIFLLSGYDDIYGFLGGEESCISKPCGPPLLPCPSNDERPTHSIDSYSLGTSGVCVFSLAAPCIIVLSVPSSAFLSVKAWRD